VSVKGAMMGRTLDGNEIRLTVAPRRHVSRVLGIR